LAVLSSASFACLSYHSRHHPQGRTEHELPPCGGSAGDNNVPHPPQTAPVITTQPHIQYIKPGYTATFAVVASGCGLFTTGEKGMVRMSAAMQRAIPRRQRPRFDLEYNL
jgi:hypothetical protein